MTPYPSSTDSTEAVEQLLREAAVYGPEAPSPPALAQRALERLDREVIHNPAAAPRRHSARLAMLVLAAGCACAVGLLLPARPVPTPARPDPIRAVIAPGRVVSETVETGETPGRPARPLRIAARPEATRARVRRNRTGSLRAVWRGPSPRSVLAQAPRLARWDVRTVHQEVVGVSPAWLVEPGSEPEEWSVSPVLVGVVATRDTPETGLPPGPRFTGSSE